MFSPEFWSCILAQLHVSHQIVCGTTETDEDSTFVPSMVWTQNVSSDCTLVSFATFCSRCFQEIWILEEKVV